MDIKDIGKVELIFEDESPVSLIGSRNLYRKKNGSYFYRTSFYNFGKKQQSLITEQRR